MRNKNSFLRITWHLVVLTPLIVSFSNFNLILSSSLPPAEHQLGPTVQGEEALTTPDLIQLAFSQLT